MSAITHKLELKIKWPSLDFESVPEEAQVIFYRVRAINPHHTVSYRLDKLAEYSKARHEPKAIKR